MTSCELDITYFPFDTQVCVLQFIEWSHITTEVTILYIEWSHIECLNIVFGGRKGGQNFFFFSVKSAISSDHDMEN